MILAYIGVCKLRVLDATTDVTIFLVMCDMNAAKGST